MRTREAKKTMRKRRSAGTRPGTRSLAAWKTEESRQLAQLRSESKYFERIRKKLWADPDYREKYVVIRNRAILDVGENQFDLARKWMKQYPNEAVLITKVELEPVRITLPDMRFR